MSITCLVLAEPRKTFAMLCVTASIVGGSSGSLAGGVMTGSATGEIGSQSILLSESGRVASSFHLASRVAGCIS